MFSPFQAKPPRSHDGTRRGSPAPSQFSGLPSTASHPLHQAHGVPPPGRHPAAPGQPWRPAGAERPLDRLPGMHWRHRHRQGCEPGSCLGNFLVEKFAVTVTTKDSERKLQECWHSFIKAWSIKIQTYDSIAVT